MRSISREEKKKLKYKYTATLMCSGNDTDNVKYLKDAKDVAKGIAERNMILANGASSVGLMGVTGRAAHEAGGEVYGIGLQDYEPEIYDWFTNWEGFSTYNYRIRRLTDVADCFIALAGGLGTIHEILDVHINQFLGKETRPIIILSPMSEIYKDLCSKIKEEGLYWEKLPEYIHFAKDAGEVLNILDRIIEKYDEEGYVNPFYYPALSSEGIYEDIKKYDEKYTVLYAGMKLVIHPDVYPPNRFRSSLIFAQHLNEEVCRDKKVLDIGCGPGNLGILAAKNGASQVISVDINPSAVENAKENVIKQGLENVDVRQGSVFEAVGNYRADLIIFHPPFHAEKIKANHTSLMNCVSTDGFNVLDKFFEDVDSYLSLNGEIYIGFSNKDKSSLKHLEKQMSVFDVTTVAHKYQGSSADYRLYRLKRK